jgi:hypothetical protein
MRRRPLNRRERLTLLGVVLGGCVSGIVAAVTGEALRAFLL